MNVFNTLDFEDITRYAIALVVIFATLAMVWYSIWWGFLMILSGWKEDKVKTAINHIRHALIGVWFLLFVLFAFPVVANILGLSYPISAKPASIMDTIQELSGKLFNNTIDNSSSTPSSVGTSDFSNL
jgi:hypothetical protein